MLNVGVVGWEVCLDSVYSCVVYYVWWWIVGLLATRILRLTHGALQLVTTSHTAINIPPIKHWVLPTAAIPYLIFIGMHGHVYTATNASEEVQ